jgi:hypothetical protein
MEYDPKNNPAYVLLREQKKRILCHGAIRVYNWIDGLKEEGNLALIPVLDHFFEPCQKFVEAQLQDFCDQMLQGREVLAIGNAQKSKFLWEQIHEKLESFDGILPSKMSELIFALLRPITSSELTDCWLRLLENWHKIAYPQLDFDEGTGIIDPSLRDMCNLYHRAEERG